jgi:hypothetical protein
MILETVDLTPEDAAKMLAISQGHHQRKLRKANIDRLTHAITSGQWRETHQAIALNRDGIVIDGQHRLTAIVAAGMTVRVLIAKDVADETFDVIDTGSVRSPYDVLTLAGIPNAAKVAAACRLILTYGMWWAALTLSSPIGRNTPQLTSSSWRALSVVTSWAILSMQPVAWPGRWAGLDSPPGWVW